MGDYVCDFLWIFFFIFFCYAILFMNIFLREYCSGGSIYDRLKGIHCDKKKFTEPEIAEILRSVLEGLAHMHERGFIHRDIKVL